MPNPPASPTPGPWTLIPHERFPGLFHIEERDSAGSVRIADVTGEGRARLLLAAPVMLRALRDVISDLELFCSRQGPGPDKRLDAARAAIRQATGE